MFVRWNSPMAEIRIGIIGYGKIAQDQHVPAIAASPAFRLVAVVAPDGAAGAPVPVYRDHHAMLREHQLDAVAICTPAGPRHGIARDCIDAGVDALLEKPPCATLGAVEDLRIAAEARHSVLFTAWHAQHNAPVARLRQLLARDGVRSLTIEWCEDVEKWHPGQQWIWQPGGFGVFDAGINALSIATLVVPAPLRVTQAAFVRRAPGDQPIAAQLAFDASGVSGAITATLDWRHQGDERWTIAGETGAGQSFLLSRGGGRLELDEVLVAESTDSEYQAVYARFAELVAARQSSIDAEPLRLVADSFLTASTEATPGPAQHD